MKEYKNNEDATKNFFVTDNDGMTNGRFNVWAYIDKKRNIHMKGRAGNEFITTNGRKIPMFMIADVILKDTKNIMSCEVVNINNKLVAHIEFYTKSHIAPIKEDEILLNALKRLNKVFENDVVENIHFIIRDSFISYPLTSCGKRNVALLEKESEEVLESITTKNSKKLLKKL